MNENKFYSFLGIIKKSGNLISGYNICEIEIKKNKCKLIIIAEDASLNTKRKFVELCEKMNIKYIVYGCKRKLGICIGKDETSVMGIENDGMSRVVLDMLK